MHSISNMHTYIQIYIRTCILYHTFVHVDIRTCMYTKVHVYMLTYIHTYAHACTHMRMFLQTGTQTDTHTFRETYFKVVPKQRYSRHSRQIYPRCLPESSETAFKADDGRIAGKDIEIDCWFLIDWDICPIRKMTTIVVADPP